MRKKRKKRIAGRLLGVLFFAALILLILSGVSKLMDHLGSYSENTTISARPPEPEPEQPQPPQEPEQLQPDGAPVLDGLPRSTLDAEKFRRENGITYYDGLPAARVGIDVSSHQQTIDWERVAAAGVEFAMIRVGYRGYSEGTLQADEYFEDNFRGAQAAGLRVGVYFFSQAISEEEAVEEAQFVLQLLDGRGLEYPVMYDWEDVEAAARTDGMDRLRLTACADAFCRTVQDAGYRAGVYFNQVFGYQELNLLSLQDYVFWLAEYRDVPEFLYAFQMWQYTNDGRIDGIEGAVDLDLSFGNP